MTLSLYAYNNASEGACKLAEALQIKKVSHTHSKLKGEAEKDIINWGASELPEEVEKCNVYNRNSWIASNKIHTFDRIKAKDYCPPFWTDKTACVEALNMAPKKYDVVCRTILNGHSGKGIVIADKPESVVDAPLYTQYIPKKDEYRIHVAFGKVIHIQRKARNKEVPDDKVNWNVRNHDNGFIFQQDGVVCPQAVIDAAIDAVDCCELDFGAVDTIWNEKNSRAYVLEINTAPGLQGTTIEKYKEAFEVLK